MRKRYLPEYITRGSLRKKLNVAQTQNSFWLTRGGVNFLGSRRIELLEKIGELGSISKAARAVKLSYKAAWDAIHEVNTISGGKLVTTATGGKEGGGARLTTRGRNLIRIYRMVESEHEKFLDHMRRNIRDFDTFYHMIRKISMKVSARNQFFGTITSLRKGAVNTELSMRLGDRTHLVAMITNESVEDLGLRKGVEAYALIKANLVIVTSGDREIKTSARNRLCGRIVRITAGQVNSSVEIEFSPGKTVTAMITRESVRKMGLKIGDRACAIFKASSVILGVAG